MLSGVYAGVILKLAAQPLKSLKTEAVTTQPLKLERLERFERLEWQGALLGKKGHWDKENDISRERMSTNY